MLFTLIVMTLLVGMFIGIFGTVLVALHLEDRKAQRFLDQFDEHPSMKSSMFDRYHESFDN